MIKMLFAVHKWKILGILIMALILYIGSLHFKAAQEKKRADNLAFSKDSIEAVLDSTVQIVYDANKSAAVWMRRAVQTKLQNDSLNERLKRMDKATVSLMVEIEKLEANVQASVQEDSNDVRSAFFEHRETPVTITASVRLPKPPAQGEAAFVTIIDPLRLNIGVGCSERPSPDGIYQANVRVDGPSWAKVSIATAAYEREVCNRKSVEATSGKWSFKRGVLVGAAGLGLIMIFGDDVVKTIRP